MPDCDMWHRYQQCIRRDAGERIPAGSRVAMRMRSIYRKDGRPTRRQKEAMGDFRDIQKSLAAAERILDNARRRGAAAIDEYEASLLAAAVATTTKDEG